MSAADLKADFPQLEILTDDELESAIAKGRMFSAFVHARIKRLTSPRPAGRPRKPPKAKKVIQRRGRLGKKISPNSTNIQLAELAQTFGECLNCSNTEAAKAVLLEVTGSTDPVLIRRLAKLMSELSGRAQDKAARRASPSSEVALTEELPSSFSAMLNHYANLRK